MTRDRITAAHDAAPAYKGEHVAVGLGTFDLDGKGRVLTATERSVEAPDQGIKLRGAQLLEAPEVCDNPMTDLSLLVAVALDELKVLAATGSRDLRIHVATVLHYGRCIITLWALHQWIKITPRATTMIPRNLPLRDAKCLVLLTCAKRNPEKSAANCRSWVGQISGEQAAALTGLAPSEGLCVGLL